MPGFCLLHVTEARQKTQTSISEFVSNSCEKDQFVKLLISLTVANNEWCVSILGRSCHDFSFLSKENLG